MGVGSGGGVDEVAIAGLGVVVGGTVVGVEVPGVFAAGVGAGETYGDLPPLLATTLFQPLTSWRPTVQASGDGRGGAQTEVIGGHGVGEEQGVRVVPVVHGGDDFGAGGGDELAEVELPVPWAWGGA